MSALPASGLLTGLLLCLMIAAGFLLTRHRDRLRRAFEPGRNDMIASVDVAPGARLALVELAGVRVICATQRGAITSFQIVPEDRA